MSSMNDYNNGTHPSPEESKDMVVDLKRLTALIYQATLRSGAVLQVDEQILETLPKGSAKLITLNVVIAATSSSCESDTLPKETQAISCSGRI